MEFARSTCKVDDVSIRRYQKVHLCMSVHKYAVILFYHRHTVQ